MSSKPCTVSAMDFARILTEFSGERFEPLMKELKDVPVDPTEEQNANAFFLFMSDNVDAGLPSLSKSTLAMILFKLKNFIKDFALMGDEVVLRVDVGTEKKELLSYALREWLPKTKVPTKEEKKQHH